MTAAERIAEGLKKSGMMKNPKKKNKAQPAPLPRPN
jgi:hypothetical protein